MGFTCTRKSDRDKPRRIAKWFIRLLSHVNAIDHTERP